MRGQTNCLFFPLLNLGKINIDKPANNQNIQTHNPLVPGSQFAIKKIDRERARNIFLVHIRFNISAPPRLLTANRLSRYAEEPVQRDSIQ